MRPVGYWNITFWSKVLPHRLPEATPVVKLMLSSIPQLPERSSPAVYAKPPIIENVLAYVDCELDSEYEAGDHTIAVGRVVEARILDSSREPLLFFRGGYGSFDPFL